MTIYYLAPDKASPKGGVRMIYRHVDALNASRLDAAVVHARSGFRCAWFANETRVLYPPIAMRAGDVLVVPEQISSGDLSRVCPGVAKVVFNQNVYRTFSKTLLRGDRVSTPYVSCPDLVGVLTASIDAERYLRYVFPNAHVTRVPYFIDPEVFHPNAAVRTRQIAVMPRKRRNEFAQLHAILALRGVLDGWHLKMLDGLSEAEVATALQQSALFISLSKDEGFGLPPAEAIACGCHVIGFHGRGGREFFVAPYAEPIEDGDVIALAQAVESFVGAYDSHRPELDRASDSGSDMILSTYSADAQSAGLIEFFAPLIDGLASSNATEQVLRRRDLERVFPRMGRVRTAILNAGRRGLR